MPPKPEYLVVKQDRRGREIEAHEAMTYEEALKIEVELERLEKTLPRRKRHHVVIKPVSHAPPS